MTEQLWSFKDTTSWGGNCNGMNQSPINIDTELVLQCKDLCDLNISYKKSTCNAKFNNNMLSLTIDQGSYITFRNVYYKLNQITVHVPSMHTLDGENTIWRCVSSTTPEIPRRVASQSVVSTKQGSPRRTREIFQSIY